MSTILKLNRLYALLMRFPEEKWNWKEVSFNQHITTAIVNRHPEWKWDWSYISSKDMTREFFEKHKKKLEFAKCLCHPCFTWKEVEDNLDDIGSYDLYDIWKKKKPDFNYILNSPKLLDRLNRGFSYNPYITWEDVMRTKDIIRWNYEDLLFAPLVRIPLEFIESSDYNLSYSFSYDSSSISQHPLLTLEIVEKYTNGITTSNDEGGAHDNDDSDAEEDEGEDVWCWEYLMKHDWFTPEVYEKYSRYMETYAHKLLENKNFSIEYLVEKRLMGEIIGGGGAEPDVIAEKIPLALLKEYEASAEIAGYLREIPIEFSKEKKLPMWTKEFDCEGFTVKAANMVMSKRQDIRCQHVVENHDKINWIALSENSFDNKRRSGKVIWRWWKKQKLEKQTRKAKEKVVEELSLLPVAFINKNFPGGEEMREASERFSTRSVKEFSASQKEM